MSDKNAVNEADPLAHSGVTSAVRWLIRVVVSLVVTVVALQIFDWLLPGFHVDGARAAILGVILLALLNTFLRPALVRLTLPLTVLTFGLVSLILNGIMLLLVSLFLPGFHVDDLWTGILLSFGFSFINGLITTAVLYHNDRDLYQYEIIKRNINKQKKGEAAHITTPGLIMLEIDGLSEPILRQALKQGDMPFLAEWVRSGEFKIIGWDTGLPAQTSAMQAGILHGSHFNIPAFRFYDKVNKRLLVSNHPKDAGDMLKPISNGSGLLKHNGFGLNNWAHGDAEDVLLTFSAMSTKSGSLKSLTTSDSMYQFFANAYSVQQVILGSIADVFIEWREHRHQRRRNIQPRIDRHMPYPLVRVGTTVVFPQLSMYLLIGKMFEGISTAYTTFVSYDEVAHHSGIERSDAYKVLAQLDEQIAWIVNASKQTDRPYEFVILSDHGQSQGATFKQRYGITLAELINQLTSSKEQAFTVIAGDEGIASINLMVSELTTSSRWMASRLASLLQSRTDDGYVTLIEDEAEKEDASATTMVCASGNLALVYFTEIPHRMTLEEIDERYPGLVDALARHPGIGFVLVRSEKDGALAIGSEGVYFLESDTIQGKNPLENFGKHAARHLLDLDKYPAVGDLVVNSFYDPEWDEVAAFEELVGSHGGLGGKQNHPFLMFPTKFDPDNKIKEVIGAPAVYNLLSEWVKDR